MKTVIALVVAFLLPQQVLAHAGDHGHAGPIHALSEPDHLAVLALVAVLILALWAVRRGRS